jgi:uncharacterized protein (DUF849 family)
MFVLGLLVLAAASVAGVELVLANRQPVVLTMWNWTWHMDAFWLAVIGAAVVMLAVIGLGAVRLGFRHERRVRRERRDLAAENARLVERARSAEAGPSARPAVAENRRTVAQQTQGYPAAPPAPAAPAAPAATAASRASARADEGAVAGGKL